MLDIELAHVSQQMVQHTPALVTLKNQSVLYRLIATCYL